MRLGNSYFGRRLLSILIVSTIAFTIFTVFFYSILARPVFVRMKEREVLPIAENLVSDLDAVSVNSITTVFYVAINNAKKLYGNFMFLLDANGSLVMNTNLGSEIKWGYSDMNDYLQFLHNKLMATDSNYVVTEKRVDPFLNSFMFVAVKIRNRDTGSDPIGTLVIMQSLQEYGSSINSLNLALISSALIVFGLMLIPVIWATRRLSKPLRDIREFASAVANEDFSKRVPVTGKGEFRELSVAMNKLADELDTTLSHLNDDKRNLQRIIEGISDGIVAFDFNGNLLYYNKSLWKIFDIDEAEEGFDKTPHELMENLNLFELIFTTIKQNTVQTTIIKKSSKEIECTISPLSSKSGMQRGAVLLFRDVTYIHNLEQTRRDYVSNVSHELRTPLTAMLGLLEPLVDGMVKDHAVIDNYHRILLNETKRLSRLINDILALSGLQGQDYIIEMEPVNLAKILKESRVRFEYLASLKKISLKMLYDDVDLPLFWSNSDRIEQILLILVDNAIKYTPENGTVTVEISKNAEKYNLCVSDTGVGIAEDDLPHIFERFYMVDKSHGSTGFGLGLAIAKEAACKMQQKLSVKSKLGSGTTFKLSLNPCTEQQLREFDL